VVTLVLTYFIFKENKVFFIVSEVFVIISVVFSIQLYRQLIKPLKLLMQGVDAIRDRDFNVKFLSTGKHEMDELITVYNHMIDELRKERTRQEQQHLFLEKLIHTSPTGIIILDYNDHIQQVNPKAQQLLAIEPKAVYDIPVNSLPHVLSQHIALLKSGETITIRPDGVNTYKLQKSHFIDRGFARHFIMIEELTTEILAAEKHVYGKVIRMMAHEVNNTIGPVNSIIQSALQTTALGEGLLKDALQVALDRNQNLNLFMRNLADLVKLPPLNKKQVSLHKLIHDVSVLMKLTADEKDIQLITDLPEAPLYIMADEQQMEQALINIVKNAIESVGGNGYVKFSVNRRQLIITDTGKGIAEDQRGLLFTPFFSTKRDGQGIGLMLVREILVNHGFEFTLKTVAEQQTEFVINF
jgi:nitrogen fixation/metabolism regulation signal transduction histidine kinase